MTKLPKRKTGNPVDPKGRTSERVSPGKGGRKEKNGG